jgi:hypothetical protein
VVTGGRRWVWMGWRLCWVSSGGRGWVGRRSIRWNHCWRRGWGGGCGRAMDCTEVADFANVAAVEVRSQQQLPTG